MTPATVAAEYKAHLSHDFTLADAYDAEYLDEPEEDETAAWQALNARMAEWYVIG